MSTQVTPVKITVFPDTTVNVTQEFFKTGQLQEAKVTIPESLWDEGNSVSLLFTSPSPQIESRRMMIEIDSYAPNNRTIIIPFTLNNTRKDFSVHAKVNIYSNNKNDAKLIYQSQLFIITNTSSGTGTLNHRSLSGRGYPDQHPISAITDLGSYLETVQLKTEETLNTAVERSTVLINKIPLHNFMSVGSLITDESGSIAKVESIDETAGTAVVSLVYAGGTNAQLIWEPIIDGNEIVE